jgi:phosphotransacetylase
MHQTTGAQVLQRNPDVDEIFNMIVVTAAQAAMQKGREATHIR